MGNVNNAIMTPCCKNIFCFSCITLSCKYSKNTCPLCRNKLKLNQLVAISKNKVETQENEKEKHDKLPTKLESLIQIIKNNPGGRFLVFSEYENSFNKIVKEFNSQDIVFSRLCGSSGRITNIINEFSSNNIQVLLLNAKHYGSGLNLQMTTDIIIYHRMSCDLENQIIGRGQRLGRTSRLNVHYLCYENENN